MTPATTTTTTLKTYNTTIGQEQIDTGALSADEAKALDDEQAAGKVAHGTMVTLAQKHPGIAYVGPLGERIPPPDGTFEAVNVDGLNNDMKHMDINAIAWLVMSVAMSINQDARHAFLKMSMDERRAMLDKAKEVYNKELEAADGNFKAAVMSAAGEIAGAMIQYKGAGSSMKNLKSSVESSARSDSKGLEAHAARTAADRDQDQLDRNKADVLSAGGRRQTTQQSLTNTQRELHDLEAQRNAVPPHPDPAALERQIAAKQLQVQRAHEEHQLANDDARVQEAALPGLEVRSSSFQRHSLTKVKDLEREEKQHAQQSDYYNKMSMAEGQYAEAKKTMYAAAGRVAGAAETMDAAKDSALAKKLSTDQEVLGANAQQFYDEFTSLRDAFNQFVASLKAISEGQAGVISSSARGIGG